MVSTSFLLNLLAALSVVGLVSYAIEKLWWFGSKRRRLVSAQALVSPNEIVQEVVVLWQKVPGTWWWPMAPVAAVVVYSSWLIFGEIIGVEWTSTTEPWLAALFVLVGSFLFQFRGMKRWLLGWTATELLFFQTSKWLTLAVALAGVLVSACTQDLEPWTRPVAEGVATIVRHPVRPEDREATISLVRELVIGDEAEGDFNYLFGNRTPHVSADSTGRMFVADPRNQRVQVFDRFGQYLRTLGRSGEGPGEFAFPLAAIVAGPHLFVSDTQRSRLSRWSLDGVLDWDHPMNVFPGYFIGPAVGLDDGNWLIRFHLPQTSTEVVAHMSAEGERLGELAPIEVPPRIAYPRTGRGQLMIYGGSTPPTYAADNHGNVYVSSLEEYQLFAYALDGSMRWALQVRTERPGVAQQEKEWVAGWFRKERFSRIGVSDLDWPDLQYALADVKVDGKGRVYVFPYVPRGMTVDRLPVDVYASDGSLILSGWLAGDIQGTYWLGSWKPGPMLGTAWQSAYGDHVYGVLEDTITGVYSVVRHRLEFPGNSP